MGKILVINEKKDQSEKLAAAMGWRKGQFCYEGTFQGKKIECVWASGHLHQLIPPDKVDPTLKWSDAPTKLLPISRNFRYELIDNSHLPKPIQAKVLYENITKRLPYVDEIIIATDADREGEAIARNIIKESGFKGAVRRAWLAAGLDKKSLTSAMASLKGEFDTIGWYRAAQARGFSDWAYQYLVRAYTFYAKYGKFGSYLGQGKGSEGVVSVGRLQTVIVSMIVRREQEINDFVPKDYYNISGEFSFHSEVFNANYAPKVTEPIISRQPAGVVWEHQKPKNGNPQLEKPLFTDKAIIEEFRQRILEKSNEAYISEYNESTEKESPPLAYALTDAQKEVGRLCGANATLTQIILEDLYEQGWTSYARTSKSELPINLYDPVERNAVLSHLINLPQLQQQAQFAMDLHNGNNPQHKPFKPKIFVNKDMEHYGIIPTHQTMSPQAFAALTPKKKKGTKVLHTAEQMRIAYEAVARRYIQAFYPPAEFGIQSLQITVPTVDLLGHAESVFKTRGKRVIELGWREAFPKKQPSEDTILPKMKKGDTGLVKDIITKKSRTKAPPRFNQISLPKELELVGKDVEDPKLRKLLQKSEGIGRPATRSSAIDTILTRGFATVKKEEFYASPKGIDLIKYVPKWLSTPETSALWEDYIGKIEVESNDKVALEMRDNFVNMQIEKIEKLIDYMNKKFLPDLGEKMSQAPKQVTQKMKDAIKRIEKQKGIKAPRGTLIDPMKASAFLSEHLSSSSKTTATGPSEAQKAFAQKIIDNLPPEQENIDGDIMSDGKLLSEFINKNKKFLPPSKKQVELLESIVATLPAGTTVPDDARKYVDACRKFIDKHKKKRVS